MPRVAVVVVADHTQELYVMVPDQFNPTFEGWVSLDHR